MNRCRQHAIAATMGAMAAGLAGAGALAGGYDTGERDWDFLFQEQPVAAEAEIRYVNPQRRITGITGVFGPSADTDEAAAFSIPRYGMAVRVGDHLRCLASYREPWGGHADYGTTWTYAASAVEQHFSSSDHGLTCALSAPLDAGRLSLVAGYSHQEIRYELVQFFGPAGFANTDVSDSSHGWRAGVAYEIPEYALRMSLIYNSQVDYDMTGVVTNPLGYSGPVFGEIAMPQSAELRFQSGVAPGWLAFGSAKWTDWSVARNMPLCPVGLPVCTQAFAASALTLLWQDTWTLTAGAAHQFSEAFAMAANLTWDQGASAGFTSQTDTWIAGLTAVLRPSANAELKLGGALGLMTGGTLSTAILADGSPNPVGYTASFGDDWLYSLSAGLILRF